MEDQRRKNAQFMDMLDEVREAMRRRCAMLHGKWCPCAQHLVLALLCAGWHHHVSERECLLSTACNRVTISIGSHAMGVAPCAPRVQRRSVTVTLTATTT